jgi:hypothetical protein
LYNHAANNVLLFLCQLSHPVQHRCVTHLYGKTLGQQVTILSFKVPGLVEITTVRPVTLS